VTGTRDCGRHALKNKSFFASFFSKKEESFFSKEKSIGSGALGQNSHPGPHATIGEAGSKKDNHEGTKNTKALLLRDSLVFFVSLSLNFFLGLRPAWLTIEKKQRPFILLAPLLLNGCMAPGVVRLTAQDADDVRRVQDYLNHTERFEAHFVQSGAYGPGAGLVWLDRPGNLRIDYEGPGSRLMVISGGRVRVLDRRTGALTTMALSRTPLGILLAPTIDLSGPVTVTSVQHVGGELEVTLEKTGQAGQGSLTLYLAEMPLRLQAVTVTDAYQRSSTLSLSDIDVAPVLTPDLFVAPAGPGAG
jgi:outer membrane lipoprotein-sorting protein